MGDQRFLVDAHGQGAMALIFGSATIFDDLTAAGTVTEGHPLIIGAPYGPAWSTQQVAAADSATALDWDGDGLRDLAIGAWGSGTEGWSAVRLVRDATTALPIGQHTYDTISDEYWAGLSPYDFINQELVAGDLNNDGYDDLVATETNVGGTIYVMFGGTAAVASGTAWDTRDVLITGSEAGGEGQIGRRLAVADLDEDGDLDLVVTDPIAPPTSSDAVLGFLSLDTTATMGHADAEVRSADRHPLRTSRATAPQTSHSAVPPLGKPMCLETTGHGTIRIPDGFASGRLCDRTHNPVGRRRFIADPHPFPSHSQRFTRGFCWAHPTTNSAFFHEPSDSGFTDDVDDVQIHVVEENGHTVAFRLVTVTTDSGEVDVVVFEPRRLRAGVAFQLANPGLPAARTVGMRWVAIRTTWTEAHDWAHAVSFFGVSQAHQNLPHSHEPARHRIRW